MSKRINLKALVAFDLTNEDVKDGDKFKRNTDIRADIVAQFQEFLEKNLAVGGRAVKVTVVGTVTDS